MLRLDLCQATHTLEPDSLIPPSLMEISRGAAAVTLEAGVNLEEVKPYLSSLKIISIIFPGFRDGRGFTLARSLREYYRFSGELRAGGDIIPDQASALKRCGFDAVTLQGEDSLQIWTKHLKPRFPFTYQQKFFKTR